MNAANRYVARLYEHCVDRGLNLEDIRLHLASQGIARSRAQVTHELENVFEFCGYAACHPAPVEESLKEFDAAIDRH